jgi:hypothetical protein
MISSSIPGEKEGKGGGKRGRIEVFSKESRYRLFRLLHTLEFKSVTFITLTYPSEFPTYGKMYKAHLKEYRRRFEKRWGSMQAVWRLEFQERGAPHFHIMYLDCPFIPIKEWCALWADVTHSKDPAHRKNGVDLKIITSSSEQRLIASYIGKYISKVDEREIKQDGKDCGRYWGKWNITEQDPIEIEVTTGLSYNLVDFARIIGRCDPSWQPVDRSICTVFGNSMGSDIFGNKLHKLLIDIKKHSL